MKQKQVQMELHQFFCVQCGNEGIPIMRKKSKKKETAHLKKLYCRYCEEEVNHCEISPSSEYQYQDFQNDRLLGKFIK
jgi:hypothetical protein